MTGGLRVVLFGAAGLSAAELAEASRFLDWCAAAEPRGPADKRLAEYRAEFVTLARRALGLVPREQP